MSRGAESRKFDLIRGIWRWHIENIANSVWAENGADVAARSYIGKTCVS